MPTLDQPGGYTQPAPNVFYAPQSPVAISGFDNTGRIVDPTLLAQQTILGRQPTAPTLSYQPSYQYQPLLTPETYQNFYNQPSSPVLQTGANAPIAAPDYRNLATQFKQDQLAAQVFAPGTGTSSGGDSSMGESAPSAWSQMSEAERAQWVQENPGAYITGKTLMSAIMPGGVILAGMQDPYLNMSLAEYHAGKASQELMGGMLPPGQGASIEVATGIPVAPTNDYVPGLFGPFTDSVDTTPAPSLSRSISATPAPAVDYGSINDFGGSGSDSYAPTANEISFSESGGYTADVGGYDSTSGYDSDTDSGGGGGGKIVCTAMNEAYGFGSFRNRIWLAYAQKNLTAAHEKGYHALFLPLVDIAYRKQTIISKPLRAVLENIARHRSADLRAEMRNKKRDNIGRAYRFVLEPLCFIVGKLKGY